MDKVVEKIVSIGVPGIMLMVAISMIGLYGAAAITAALALLGPGGMIGGGVTLLVAGAIASAISEYGFNAFLGRSSRRCTATGKRKNPSGLKSREALGQKR